MWVNFGFGVANLGLQIGQTIGQSHDQQAIRSTQEYSLKRQDAIEKSITKGYNGYVTHEDGSIEWKGFEDIPVDGGGTLRDLTNEYTSRMEKTYWTPYSEKKGTDAINSIISESNIEIMRQMRAPVMNQREGLFQANYKSALESSVRTNNFNLVQDVINSTSAWKSEEEREILAKQALDEYDLRTKTNNAIGILRTEGIVKAEESLWQSGLSGETVIKAVSTLQAANIDIKKTATASAAETYDAARKEGGTIRQAYDAAVAQDTSNPDTLEARKEEAARKQIYDLSERFAQETNGVTTVEQLEALAELHKDGGAYDPDYYGQEGTQKDFHEKILSRIAAIKQAELAAEEKAIEKQEKAEAKAERAATKAEQAAEKQKKAEEKLLKDHVTKLRNTVFDSLDQWRKGKENGLAVYQMAQVFSEHFTTEELQKIETELLTGNDGTGSEAARQYARLEAILKANAPDKEKSTMAERDAYTLRTQQITDSIMEFRFRVGTGEPLKNEVDRILEVETSTILKEALNNSDVGTTGLAGSAPGPVKEYLWFANQGKLDAYFGERSTRELEFDDAGRVIAGTRPLTIGGANMETVAKQVAEFGKEYLDRELGQAGITISEGEMMPGKTDERGGNFWYKGSDGKWYRLGVTSRDGDFIIEESTDNGWKKVDVRKHPRFTPRLPSIPAFDLQSGRTTW